MNEKIDLDKHMEENSHIKPSEKEAIQSGGRSRFLDSLNNAFDNPIAQNELAEKYYKDIRQGKNYELIRRVAKHSKMSYADIEKIVNHIFIQRHKFRNGRFERFYPDVEIAQAFERLKRGEHTDIDILLLNHELLELTYIKNKKYNIYETAHKMANKKYNWQRRLKENENVQKRL